MSIVKVPRMSDIPLDDLWLLCRDTLYISSKDDEVFFYGVDGLLTKSTSVYYSRLPKGVFDKESFYRVHKGLRVKKSLISWDESTGVGKYTLNGFERYAIDVRTPQQIHVLKDYLLVYSNLGYYKTPYCKLVYLVSSKATVYARFVWGEKLTTSLFLRVKEALDVAEGALCIPFGRNALHTPIYAFSYLFRWADEELRGRIALIRKALETFPCEEYGIDRDAYVDYLMSIRDKTFLAFHSMGEFEKVDNIHVSKTPLIPMEFKFNEVFSVVEERKGSAILRVVLLDKSIVYTIIPITKFMRQCFA